MKTDNPQSKFYNNLKLITQQLKSCSVVNADGQLVFSKDTEADQLCTTRLVSFQIIKKYLNPKLGDLFIMNDPENGGFHFSKLIFVAALSEKIFLIWNEDHLFIDFKIPPTPVYEKYEKTTFVWQALVEPSPYFEVMTKAFEKNKLFIQNLSSKKNAIQFLSEPKNQQFWFKQCLDAFEHQFSNKAQGSGVVSFKITPNQLLKVKIQIEEKQNIQMLCFDFSGTSPASDICASSHIIESVLVKKIVDHYNLTSFFSQKILDKIKLLLPPKSIASKSNSLGQHNVYLQSLCAQASDYILGSLNQQTKKLAAAFQFTDHLSMHLSCGDCFSNFNLAASSGSIVGLEELITHKKIELLSMMKSENQMNIKFKVATPEASRLNIFSKGVVVNDVSLTCGLHTLKLDDVVEILV